LAVAEALVFMFHSDKEESNISETTPIVVNFFEKEIEKLKLDDDVDVKETILLIK
jgi:hypothetical protein